MNVDFPINVSRNVQHFDTRIIPEAFPQKKLMSNLLRINILPKKKNNQNNIQLNDAYLLFKIAFSKKFQEN